MSSQSDAIMEWIESGRAALAAARGDPERVAKDLFAFCLRGRHQLGLSPLEVWDHIAVNQPGLLERAGYGKDEIEQCELAVEMSWVRAFEGWSSRDDLRE